MDEMVRQELLAKTKQALAADNWDAVENLWQPWVQQDDPEAQYQLASHYLWRAPCDDDATSGQMMELVKRAAAKDHPDAIWFLANRQTDSPETDPEYQRQLLRAGKLGSIHAQRDLGARYATGDWSGPTDLAEAARWYRLAAEAGHAESQYDLGFMLLLGQGGPKDTGEGLLWLERAGEQGNYGALRLLAECYEEGQCDVPVNAAKAQLWRGRLTEFQRLNPPRPSREYSMGGPASRSSLECLWEIEGVLGFAFVTGDTSFSLYYDPELTTPAQLDAAILAARIAVVPVE